LQLHQTKVTFRNISTKFETAKQILAMISQMVEKVNEESKCLPIKIDEKSIEKILKIEELAAEEIKEKDTSAADTEIQEAEVDETVRRNENGKSTADIIKSQGKDLCIPFISARALYVVTPKTSRRRGDKNGCAYLVLTPPPPPLPHSKQGEMSGIVSQGYDVDDGDGSESTKEQIVPQYTQAERSRLTAISKLQLIQSIEVLSEIAEQDAKSQQIYGECQVEASTSGKAWRDKEGGNRDRREGTIENTSDYKQFFNKQTKAEEERQNRPKPAPGGGVVGASNESGEDEEQLSAIVLHLRAKHKEQNQRKKAKKKANKEAKKVNKSQSSAGTNSNSTSRDSKNRNSSKVGTGGSRGKSRRESSKNKSSSGVQGPVVLMKSSQNGSG